MHIEVASRNPVKINASLLAFQQMFPEEEWQVSGTSVPSGVAAQPMSEAETWQGAYNRVLALKQKVPHADYWVGIEGGIARHGDDMETFAWVLVASAERMSKARSAGFFIPPQVVELVNSGIELGHANDQLFQAENSKQKGGALGLLTHGTLTRTDLYVPALMMALIPFRRPDLYSQ